MSEFSILSSALGEVFEPQIDEFLKTVDLELHYKFSDKYNRKINKLIKRREKPYFKLICTTWRRVVCAAAAVIIILASSLSVEAVRETIHDFLMNIFKGYTTVSVSETIKEYPTVIEEEYEISNLPEGFELSEYFDDENSVFAAYFNGEKYIFFQQTVYYDFNANFDNSHSEFEYYTDISGQEYLIHDTGRDYCVTFNNGKYIILITSNLDKKEIMNLCKDTKIK
ncbi:MAG: DUF4367 domain-containing protein [Oscillospiraceae bacterium]|nr:DUF4367 domain-containing protein [Oscillospiraceae bacterium]